jgi:hypothetical protein
MGLEINNVNQTEGLSNTHKVNAPVDTNEPKIGTFGYGFPSDECDNFTDTRFGDLAEKFKFDPPEYTMITQNFSPTVEDFNEMAPLDDCLKGTEKACCEV